MKVLMIAPQPFREPRGTPISVFQRLTGLSALGHEVDLLTYPYGEDVSIPGVTIHRGPRVPGLKGVKIGPSLPKLLLDVLLLAKAVAMLARKRYDVIHSHEEAGFFAPLLSALFGTRHVYDMHSSLPRQLGNFRYGKYEGLVKLFAVLERWTVNTSDAVITIGSDLERHVKEINPHANQVRIENLPVQAGGGDLDGREVARLRQELGLEGRQVVLYTGTLEGYQGIDLLLESATIAAKQCPDLVLLIVGGKPDQVEHWRREAGARGLGDTVRFVGSVPLEVVPAYMELAGILVSPRTGGISVPLKIYSYLLSGKPVVATRLPTHTLVLTDETAVLVEPSGPAFAEGIARLVRDPELGRSLGAAARRFAEKQYDPAEYLDKLNSLYLSLEPSRAAGRRPVVLPMTPDANRGPRPVEAVGEERRAA